MPYTVQQVAAMSSVRVRTLHFYDETGLLKRCRFFHARPFISGCAGDTPAKIINVYQPTDKIECFFGHVGSRSREQLIHEDMRIDQFRRLFENHGMKLAGAPLKGEWKVSDKGQMVRISHKSA
jgi:hypothetical protein